MTTTVLYGERTSSVKAAEVRAGHLWLSPEDFYQATDWKLETQGLCRGDTCVQTQAAWLDDAGRIDLSAFAEHLGQPAIRDEANNAWAFGESVNRRRDQLFSGQAPDFSLPDLAGKQHQLSDYRGKKIFMYSWGSY